MRKKSNAIHPVFKAKFAEADTADSPKWNQESFRI